MQKEFMTADVANNHVSTTHIYVADSTDDIPNLPGIDSTAFGSMAIVIDPPSIYMLNSGGEWIEYSAGDNSGSDDDSDITSAIVGAAIVGSATVGSGDNSTGSTIANNG